MTWAPWMGPTVTIEEALRSPEKRRERDVQLAAWCGLQGGEADNFLGYLALYDVHEEARREEEAIDRLRAARAERERLEQEDLGREMEAPRVLIPGGGWA